MNKSEIRFCGLGGQGIIMTAMVIGKAACIFEDRFATLVQSFGPEARGSTCSAQVMISDAPVAFPYVRASDVLVAFSQSAYDRFIGELKPGAMLVYERDLVTVDSRLPEGVRTFGVPATKIADEQLGRRIVSNMVMVGFIVKTTGLVSRESAVEAIKTLVPTGTEKFNIKAFDAGFSFA